jgi:hypothetical protein
VTLVLLARDLMIASRVEVAARHVGVPLLRIGDPDDLPPAASVRLLLVDWGDREPDWGERIRAWRAGPPESAQPGVVLFGPHVDLGAHAAAREAGLGPMLARSKLVGDLPALIGRTRDH